MSESVTLEDLKVLLTKLEPDQIETRHGPHLTQEARAYLDEYKSFANRMEHISDDFEKLRLQENLSYLSKEPPEIKTPIPSQKTKAPLVFQLGAALAAALILGFIWQTVIQTDAPPEGLPRAIQTPMTPEAEPHHLAIFQALKNRGVFYMDQQTQTGSQLALKDFEQAYTINPDDRELITLLTIVCENLQLKDKAKRYKERLNQLDPNK